MRRLILTFFSVICFLSVSSSVFAVTINISNTPESIDDQPFEFNISISGAQSGTNYLRADLFIPNTIKYFGYTFNGSNYYNESTFSQYLPININSEGSGSATIKAKIDPESSSFEGPGNYSLKVRRYTSQSSYTWSNEATVNITYSLPITAAPTEKPVSADTPTPTKSPTPTKTPTPTKKPTVTPTKLPSNQPTSTSIQSESTQIQDSQDNKVTLPQSILGSSTDSADLSPTPTTTENNAFSFKNLLFIAGGIILILLGIFIFTFIAKDRFKKI